MFKVAILTISDRCSRGEMSDETGKKLKNILDENFNVVEYKIVPDEKVIIKKEIKYFSDVKKVDMVLTNGGTGLGPRDVTPEATGEVIERIVPGLPELMRSIGSEKTKRAFLSRAVAGTRGHVLIINLPGSPQACEESLSCILEILVHAIEMLRGGRH